MRKSKIEFLLILWVVSEALFIRYLENSGILLEKPINYIITEALIFWLFIGFLIHQKKQLKKRRYLKSSIRKIDLMSGEEFENLLSAHFEKAGYRVKLTPKSNDYGADLVLKKNGKITIVQAKRYKGKVSNSAVQEIVAAKPYYNADYAMVVTNSYYTNNAKVLADANGVVLWDRTQLIKNFHIKNKDR